MTVTPDGSPVEVYLRLPPRGEAELVHGANPTGADVLELGCGVGLDDDELERALSRAGLTLARAVDERGLWVEARLYSDA